MFYTFSWLHYFLFISILLVVYAIVICFVYYKKEIAKLLLPKRTSLNEMISGPVKDAADRSGMVHELVSELGVLIRNAAEDSITQPELFYSIQQTLKNYLVLSLTDYKSKINQYIKEELEIRKLPDFSIEEYQALWK